MANKIINSHWNYQNLESYRNSAVIYDATQVFCQRFLMRRDRTVDQMIQAARSGKQNIIEGSMASGTSTESEIKLIGVARAGLEELLEDYRDYLRTHNQQLWQKDEPRTLKLRAIAKNRSNTYETYKPYIDSDDTELICNLMISLIHQTNYLLDRQLLALEKQFLEKGGLRERMRNARKKARSEIHLPNIADELALLRNIYHSVLALPGDNQNILNDIATLGTRLKDLTHNQ